MYMGEIYSIFASVDTAVTCIPNKRPKKLAHFTTLGLATPQMTSIIVIKRLKSMDPDFRKKRGSYGFMIYSTSLFPCRDELTWISRYVISVDATGLCISCTHPLFLFTRHVDVFCLATYKNMPICHQFCTPEEDNINSNVCIIEVLSQDICGKFRLQPPTMFC